MICAIDQNLLLSQRRMGNMNSVQCTACSVQYVIHRVQFVVFVLHMGFCCFQSSVCSMECLE